MWFLRTHSDASYNRVIYSHEVLQQGITWQVQNTHSESANYTHIDSSQRSPSVWKLLRRNGGGGLSFHLPSLSGGSNEDTIEARHCLCELVSQQRRKGVLMILMKWASRNQGI